MTSIDAVLFDLDETLMDRQGSLKRFLAAQWSSRLPLQALSLAEYQRQFLEYDQNGKVWKDIVYLNLLLRNNIRQVNSDALLQEYLTGFSIHAQLFPDVVEVLQNLKQRKLKLGIITNGRVDLQSSVISACHLEDLMDTIQISEAVGAKKPDPAIFNNALAALDISAKTCLFVGDNPKADIEGAHRAGMKTVWLQNTFFSPPQPTMTTAILTDFKSLPEIIDRL